MVHKPNNNWNETETNTEMRHQPNDILKLKLKYNDWTNTEMGHQPHDTLNLKKKIRQMNKHWNGTPTEWLLKRNEHWNGTPTKQYTEVETKIGQLKQNWNEHWNWTETQRYTKVETRHQPNKNWN